MHAIATTNASIAGLLVIEACKILSGCKQYAKESFIGKHCLLGSTKRRRDFLIRSVKPPAENPNCVACGKSILHIALDTMTMTLGQFLEKVSFLSSANSVIPSYSRLFADGLVWQFPT